MDCKTVLARVKHEGLSFLTITLSDFGKAFECCLDQGHLDRRLFTGFRFGAELPLFLGGFLDLVFDRNSGELLEDPSIDAIRSIRQLTLMFKRVSVPCSDARNRKAVERYLECEQDVMMDAVRIRNSPIDLEAFHRISSMLFANVFTWIDRKVFRGDIMPKHGPGSTADGLLGNKKFNQTVWPIRLEGYFPMLENILPNSRYYEELDGIDILEPDQEVPVKVTLVPKTLKTPRIIAQEPTAMQYAQQSLLEVILEGLRAEHEEIRKSHYLRSFLGFDDQTINNRMALEGSLSGDSATLDLSDASDRVSNELVMELLRNHLHLREAVAACRSTKAHVPIVDRVIELNKYASMGSALCFPMEAMMFLVMVFVGIEEGLARPLTGKDIYAFIGKVRIYGDDIIIPVEFVRPVLRSLERFGARVNDTKSFWTGKFRESCGKEYYDGNDVSIVKLNHLLPTNRQDAAGIKSMVAFRNHLYFGGYWATCSWLDGYILDLIRHFPVVLPSSPVHGRHSFLGYETQRMCTRLFRPLVKGWVDDPRIPENPLDGTGALLKFFLKRGGQPSADEKHLERSGRPQSVYIKLRNATPY
jgi:hypothetical protein